MIPCQRARLLAVFAATLFISASALRATPPGKGWALAWSDEFNGNSLDTSKWSIFTGPYNQATDTASAISVANGELLMKVYTSGGTNYASWIGTDGHFQSAYGYWEARIRMNSSPGEWNAFWIQSPTINNTGNNPAANGAEIDVIEHRKQDSSGNDLTDNASINIHWNGYGSSEMSVGTNVTPGGSSLQGNWHTYALGWTPSTYYFYIDDQLVYSTSSGVAQISEFIYLSMIVNGASWAGPVPSGGYGDVNSTSTTMEVDYVRFYQPAELVVDGDYEAMLGPWGTSGQVSWASTSGVSSSGAIHLAPTSSSGATSQETVYGLLTNAPYVLSGWGNVSSQQLNIGAKNFGGSQVFTGLTANTYSQALTPFTTGSSNTTATVFTWTPTQGANAYADNVALFRSGRVTNAGLEQRGFGVWTSYGNTSVASDSNAHSGGSELAFTASTVASGAEQVIYGLSPSTTYRLTGWTKNGNQGINIGAKNYGGADTSVNVKSSTYARGSVTFTTGATNTNGTIYAWRSTSTANSYADDFFLSQPLSGAWSDQDVGSVALAGIGGMLGSSLVAQGSGGDIWGTADQFHFIDQQLAGDGYITAHVASVENLNTQSKAGVMMRATLDGASQHVMLNWTPGQILEWIWRASSGATSNAEDQSNFATPPWVRIERRGNVFTGLYSTDGVNWIPAGDAQTIAMPSTIYVGIPVCSHDTAAYVEGTVDNVSVGTALAPGIALATPVPPFFSGAITVYGAPANLDLATTITDSGQHGAVTQQWSVVSGPSGAAFANPSATNTSVYLPQTGSYVFRCTATNSVGSNLVIVPVNVNLSPDPSLSLWLKFNETSGTIAADSSGAGNNGALIGGATWLPAGEIAGAISFDGSTGYVNVPDASNLDNTSALTISFWFLANGLANTQGLVSKRDGITTNNAYTTFLQTDGHIYVDLDSNNDRFSSNTVFSTGAWYHVAVVYNGSLPQAQRAQLYVDGVLDITAGETSTAIPNYPSSVKVGYTNTGSTNYLNGSVDDVRIYLRALSATEIAGLASPAIAPVAVTGGAPSATSAVAVNLNGSGNNELGVAPTLGWSQVGGPGPVSFGNAASGTTSVTFPQAGAYVLQLLATNSVASTFNDLTVNVSSNSAVFADWISGFFPGVTNPNVVGMSATPMHDGASNLAKFALGLNPAAPARPASAPGQLGLPGQTWCNVGGVNYLAISVRRPIGLVGVTYASIVSGDLQSWTAGVQQGSPVSNGDGTETVIFRDTVPNSQANRRYIQLQITHQ